MATQKKDTITNLKQELKELRRQLTKTRLDIKTGEEENTNVHQPIKKQIAQTLTKIRQLQLQK